MSGAPKKVRASSHPLFHICPSSQRVTQNPWNRPSGAANLGTATHAALAFYVTAGTLPDLLVVAEEHGVDVTDLEILVGIGVRLWERDLARYFQDPKVEEFIPDERAPGTADVREWSADQAVILDWKSGWILGDVFRQTRAYAYLLWKENGRRVPSCGFVVSIAAFLRHRKLIVHRYDQANLEAFEEDHDRQVRRIGKEYAPGDHCGFCQRFGVCRAREQWSRAGARALEAEVPSSPSAEDLIALRPQAKALEKLLGEYNKALRAAVVAMGSVPLGNGKALTLQEQTRKRIDALTAWPLLTSELTPDQINSVISVGKTELERLIGEKAPRGHKGKAKAAFLDRLAEAGAISETATNRLTEVAEEDLEK